MPSQGSQDRIFEWYYNSSNSDVDFLSRQIERIKPFAAYLECPDFDGIGGLRCGCRPQFQYQQFPDHLTSNLVVAHEGVDVDFYPG